MHNDLNKSITTIKGIGPKKESYLNKLGLYKMIDLICDFPRSYEDLGEIVSPCMSFLGHKIVFKGKMLKKQVKFSRNRHSKLFVLNIESASGLVEITFFNAKYMKDDFKEGETYIFYGKLEKMKDYYKMAQPEYYTENKYNRMPRIRPVYGLTQSLTQNERRKIQMQIRGVMDQMEEFLPEETLLRNKLCDINFAFKNVHFPENREYLKVARYRLIFDELLILQLGLFLIKDIGKNKVAGIKFSKTISTNDFFSRLPFQLTDAQERVVKEIEEDMVSEHAMNRLIQGDVGSGKTVVAFGAVYKAVKSGYQAAMMVPTGILAQQHYENAIQMFGAYGFRVELLVSQISKKKKQKIIADIENGNIDFIIGTHAIIQDNIIFKRLGIAITDEQHRFGVKQRDIFSKKGLNPDVLVMTATPIPRTLALILYGDLDVSSIDELPPGRKPIKTYVIDLQKRKKAYEFAAEEMKLGRQVYVVAPLIEDSETIEAFSAETLYETLKEDVFKNFNVGLLHGALKNEEKEKIMDDFKEKKIDVLISTVVIEVGVNIPNASVMIIENSERFGLAQLHQLRGRIGRGSDQSYCILLNYSKSQVARKRAAIMQETIDGFKISEADLETRGPGDFFGTKQHGLPELKIANLFKHINVLKNVQKEIKLILVEDSFLENKENQNLYRKISSTFKETLENIIL